MFADNKRISLRQMRRLLTFDMLGIGCLFLPALLAGLCGVWGLCCIVTGVILAYIYIIILKKTMETMGTELFSYMGSRLLAGVLMLVMTVFAGWCLKQFVDLILVSLLPEEAFWEIGLVIILISMYAVSGGMESRARIYEILFFFIIVPLVIMLIAAVPDINPQYLMAFGEKYVGSFELDKFWIGSTACFFVFTVLFFVLFFPGKVTKGSGSRIAANAAVSLGLVAAILALLYVVLVGNFGSLALARMKNPVISLMNTVQIKGSFFKRTDALMCGIWFFTMLAIVNMNIFYSAKALDKVLGKQVKYGFVATGALGYILALALNSQEEIMEKFVKAVGIIGLPLVILIPMLIILKGCGSKELENRCFPMMMVVDKAKDQVVVSYVFPKSKEEIRVAPTYGHNFESAKKKQDRNLSKLPDFNHIKVILLSRKIVEDREHYNELLDYGFITETYPRNTYVCVTDDVKGVMEAGEKVSADLGTYIEELLEYHPLKEGSPLVTIGKLMDENINKSQKLKIPYISTVDGTICWEKFYMTE